MTLLAPLALLALLPWAAVAWRMLRATPGRAAVPFLQLWPTRTRPAAVAARRRRPPPAFVLLALAAALLALLAAARPVVFLGTGGSDLTVIVDRGDTMSLTLPDGRTRLRAFAAAHPDLLAPLEGASFRTRFVPEADADAADWARATPSAGAVSETLARTVRKSLTDGAGVLVVTDRDVATRDPRLFVVGPTDPPPADAAIVHVGVDSGGLLATLRGDGPATLELFVGEQVVASRPVVAGVSGYVFDLPPEADAAVVRLVKNAPDAWPADDHYGVARVRAWPAVAASSPAPEPLRRFVGLFTQLRPPRPFSRRVTVGPEPQAVVRLADAARVTAGDWAVSADAPAAGVDWAALSGVRAAEYPFAEDAAWRPVVRRGGDVLLALRDGDRRAWVGFDADGFSATGTFVRFWADLLTWANGGPERWDSTRLADDELQTLSPEGAAAAVTAGVDAAGRPSATRAPVPAAAAAEPWDAAALAAFLRARRRGTALAPVLSGVAVACLAAAAWRWPRRERP